MATLTLPADLTIAQLEPVRAELAAIVAATGPVTVKGAAVERVDTAALQLLCAVVVAGAPIVWDSPSSALVAAAGRCGLATHLGLPASQA